MKKAMLGLLAFVAIVAVSVPAYAQFRRAGAAPAAARPVAAGYAGAHGLYVGGVYNYYYCPFPTRPFYHPGGIYTYTQYQLVWTGWGYAYQPVAYQVYVPGGVYCQ